MVLRSPHLELMDIEQWVPRAASDAAHTAVDYEDLVEQSGTAEHPLVLITPLLSQQAQGLLERLVRSIGMDYPGCVHLRLLDRQLYSNSGFCSYLQQRLGEWPDSEVVQLGGAPLPLQGVMSTDDPDELLRQPGNKRKVWQLLKQLYTRLAQ